MKQNANKVFSMGRKNVFIGFVFHKFIVSFDVVACELEISMVSMSVIILLCEVVFSRKYDILF